MKIKKRIDKNPNCGFRISQSALGRFQDCRQKARWALDGWVPKTPSRPLLFGNFFHNCLAVVNVYINKHKEIPNEETLENIVNDEWEAFLKTPEAASRDVCETMQYDSQVIYVMLKNYIEHYFQQDVKRNWVNVEGRVDIKYANNRLMGFLDGAYEMNDGKELWVFETKTRSREDLESLGRILHMEFQTFYYMHMMLLTTGRLPNGICYNIVFKPSIKIKKGETMPQFMQRLDKDIKTDRTRYFQRLEVSIDPTEYDKWRDTTLNPLLNDYTRWAVGQGPTYRNTANCNGKYGKCPYLELCSMGSTINVKKQEYGGRK